MPHEALLLNSLRVLLGVAPVMEATVAGWCQAGRLARRRAASRSASREGVPPLHTSFNARSDRPTAQCRVRDISLASACPHMKVPCIRIASLRWHGIQAMFSSSVQFM